MVQRDNNWGGKGQKTNKINLSCKIEQRNLEEIVIQKGRGNRGTEGNGKMNYFMKQSYDGHHKNALKTLWFLAIKNVYKGILQEEFKK